MKERNEKPPSAGGKRQFIEVAVEPLHLEGHTKGLSKDTEGASMTSRDARAERSATPGPRPFVLKEGAHKTA